MKNHITETLIENLKKQSFDNKSKFWKRISIEIARTGKNARVVNLSKIDKLAKEGETIIVPGKVLSMGNLTKKMTVVAYKFSETAKEKIKKSGAKTMNIEELMKINPKGKKVKIIG